MTGIRRASWIATVAVAATAVGAFAVGARAFAHQGGERCTPPPVPVGQVHADNSWRTGAIRVMGCHAWHRIHDKRHTLVRVSSH